MKQNPVRIIYPQIFYQDAEATIQRRFRGIKDLDNFGNLIRWSAMKINFVILLKLHPSPPLRMFSWYVSKQLSCKHGVEIMLVQRCFSVVTLKQNWIKVISTQCVYRLFIWTPITACLWTPYALCKRYPLAIHLKIRKQLMKVVPGKKCS